MSNLESRSRPRSRNGIYSYFIRVTDVRISPGELERLKQHAVKVVEGEDALLIVGMSWVAIVQKIQGYEYENVVVRCFKDECIPSDEIEPWYVLDERRLPTSIELIYERTKGTLSGIEDYTITVKYNYVMYDATVAMTIDPLDIEKLYSDEELKLLTEIISRSRALVRPM